MDMQLQGTPTLVDDIVASGPGRKSAFSKALFFAAKLIVSAACFWYVLRQMNLTETIRTLPSFDVRWAAFAVSVAMAQIPLLALRLWAIVQELAPKSTRLTRNGRAAPAHFDLKNRAVARPIAKAPTTNQQEVDA